LFKSSFFSGLMLTLIFPAEALGLAFDKPPFTPYNPTPALVGAVCSHLLWWFLFYTFLWRLSTPKSIYDSSEMIGAVPFPFSFFLCLIDP